MFIQTCTYQHYNLQRGIEFCFLLNAHIFYRLIQDTGQVTIRSGGPGVYRAVTMTNMAKTFASEEKVSLKVSALTLQMFHMPTVDDAPDINPVVHLVP